MMKLLDKLIGKEKWFVVNGQVVKMTLKNITITLYYVQFIKEIVKAKANLIVSDSGPQIVNFIIKIILLIDQYIKQVLGLYKM